jgi:hypothetical protein
MHGKEDKTSIGKMVARDKGSDGDKDYSKENSETTSAQKQKGECNQSGFANACINLGTQAIIPSFCIGPANGVNS